MLDYAHKNNLELTGYAYEVGLNDFVISNADDYITKIMIKIVENSWFYIGPMFELRIKWLKSHW